MSEEATTKEQETQAAPQGADLGVKYMLGKKLHMTQIFTDDSRAIPGTIVEVEPMTVTQIKTNEKDGYSAVQVGYGTRKEKHTNKAQSIKGDFEGFHEIRLENDTDAVKVGDTIDLNQFASGDKVAVTGISKGKGFQGGVKRHNFSGGRRSHGNKHHERTIGSIGVGGVQHVLKGKRMPGRMGSDRITTKGLEVIHANQEEGFVVIKGAVPGRTGTLIEIRG